MRMMDDSGDARVSLSVALHEFLADSHFPVPAAGAPCRRSVTEFVVMAIICTCVCSAWSSVTQDGWAAGPSARDNPTNHTGRSRPTATQAVKDQVLYCTSFKGRWSAMSRKTWYRPSR